MNENLLITPLGTAVVTLHTADGLVTREGKIMGSWARTPVVGMVAGNWTVSHLPTGRTVGFGFASARQADNFMDALAELADQEGVDVATEDALAVSSRLQPLKRRILELVAEGAGFAIRHSIPSTKGARA